jgi:hypothetical protein
LETLRFPHYEPGKVGIFEIVSTPKNFTYQSQEEMGGEEVRWWEGHISIWKEFEDRLNPNLPLQALIANLLPPDQRYVKILDVGAGPLTIVGKQYLDYDIDLTAVDHWQTNTLS